MHPLLEHGRAGILFEARHPDQGLLPALRDMHPVQRERPLARRCDAVPCVRSLEVARVCRCPRFSVVSEP
eukprot:3546501-Pyramimonas_sp.AAC.1